MSYQEKRTIVTVLVGFLVFIAYLIFILLRYQNNSLDASDLKFWSKNMLIFIGIGIIATIITQILFHIFYSIGFAIKEKMKNPELSDKEIEKSIKSQMVTDEMDKIVELKSMRIGFVFAGIGFVLSLVLVLLDYSASVMINTIFISFQLGSIFEGLMQLYYYKRGIRYA